MHTSGIGSHTLNCRYEMSAKNWGPWPLRPPLFLCLCKDVKVEYNELIALNWESASCPVQGSSSEIACNVNITSSKLFLSEWMNCLKPRHVSRRCFNVVGGLLALRAFWISSWTFADAFRKLYKVLIILRKFWISNFLIRSLLKQTLSTSHEYLMHRHSTVHKHLLCSTPNFGILKSKAYCQKWSSICTLGMPKFYKYLFDSKMWCSSAYTKNFSILVISIASSQIILLNNIADFISCSMCLNIFTQSVYFGSVGLHTNGYYQKGE